MHILASRVLASKQCQINKISESEPKNKICLVSSIHEIAKILGAEASTKELIEIYDSFLKDESVKYEAYMNLPNFLRELFPESRDKYKSLIKSMGRDQNN